jgi:hypothetical protein
VLCPACRKIRKIRRLRICGHSSTPVPKSGLSSMT